MIHFDLNALTVLREARERVGLDSRENMIRQLALMQGEAIDAWDMLDIDSDKAHRVYATGEALAVVFNNPEKWARIVALINLDQGRPRQRR